MYRLILAAIALGLLVACSGDPRPPSEVDAKFICEKFIKGRLKSPGTAEFSGVFDTKYSVHTRTNENTRITVVGYVDAQNSFGGTMRNNYGCTVSTTDMGKNWQLDELAMN